jgi:hypothetical protein
MSLGHEKRPEQALTAEAYYTHRPLLRNQNLNTFTLIPVMASAGIFLGHKSLIRRLIFGALALKFAKNAQ